MAPQTEYREAKGALRTEHRALRRQIAPAIAAEAALRAAQHLATHRLWSASQHVGLFLANDGELDPAPIAANARQAGKTLYLPSIQGQSLEFRRWDADTPLHPNRYGIGESAGAPQAGSNLDLLVIPLVAWSPSGARLGMGGGFYDRFIAALPDQRPFLLGLAYSSQQDERIDAMRESWDAPLDGVLTEEGLALCNSEAS